MNRESRIADLVIHGWEPIRAGCWYGIGNRDLGPGFVLAVNTREGYQSYVDRVYNVIVWAEATWNDVTDEILDKIEAGLSTA